MRTISRIRRVNRGNPMLAGFLICSVSLLATPSLAQKASPYARINADAAAASIVIERLRGGIAVLEGSGGNIGVLAGSDGFLLVDSGIAVSKEKILVALRSLGPGPIRYVIDTHWHWDHTDGNGWMRAAGAEIIADRNTVKRLSETIRVVEWEHTFTPVKTSELPTTVVDGQRTLNFADEAVSIRLYPPPGHTDTDLSVYFPKADVLHVGDVWWNGYFPFIDYVAGGSIDGTIRAVDESLEMATDQTQIIPGHGRVGGRSDLLAFRAMLSDVRDKVATLKSQGKSVSETIAARPTADYDATFGKGLIDPALFTALVYRGV